MSMPAFFRIAGDDEIGHAGHDGRPVDFAGLRARGIPIRSLSVAH